ncbi:hypothetical protein DFH06DRAFT_709907 [Mycena polygramma]|nr:hypothetical protein DFH06DRAFT_709907 [Mycena polygramma]
MLAMLEADRARVAELELEILQLESSISQLRRAQSQVQQRLHSYKYPVLTLPGELVSEIFVHVLPPRPDFPQLAGLLSPTPLTQICRKWREIALGTPRLWSALSSFDYDQDEWELRIFKLWLKRSGSSPLSIRVDTERMWGKKKLVAAVLPHRARCQYLTIDLEAVDLRRILDAPMPLLRHLELMVNQDPLHGIAVTGSPLLRSVTLNCVAALRVILPWTQLTSLTLRAMYSSECVPILVQTHNLVHCKLNVFFSNFEPQAIMLSHLESLVFVHPGGPPAAELFESFVVPALRILEVPQSYLAPDPFDSLSAFISKSGCTLQELHLTGAREMTEKSYRQAFSFIPNLFFDYAMPKREDWRHPHSSDDY